MHKLATHPNEVANFFEAHEVRGSHDPTFMASLATSKFTIAAALAYTRGVQETEALEADEVDDHWTTLEACSAEEWALNTRQVAGAVGDHVGARVIGGDDEDVSVPALYDATLAEARVMYAALLAASYTAMTWNAA